MCDELDKGTCEHVSTGPAQQAGLKLEQEGFRADSRENVFAANNHKIQMSKLSKRIRPLLFHCL